MWNKRDKKTTEVEPTQPKIHVTPSGKRYVDPEELLRTKRAQELMDKMAKLRFP